MVIYTAPVAIFLDQPEETIKAQTGGRGKLWLFRQRKNGLPVHRRGTANNVRYFVLPAELQRFLLDTSEVV